MTIELKSIHLKNFKSHRDFTFEPEGKDASIYGDNRTGKSTIYDAFIWLLFGKNSEGKTEFSVKPIGMDRPEVEVRAILVIDGKETELKKTLVEKWTKKRGSKEETFTGHTTKHYMNGLEITTGEYKAYLDNLVGEDTFKMLTSAAFFLSMRKLEMRALLVEMAGAANIDVGTGNEFADLKQYLEDKGFTVEDALKLTKQNIALYKAENDKLNVRIDEVERSKPAEPEHGWQAIEDGLAKARAELKKIDEQLGSLHLANLELRKTQGEIAVLEGEVRNYRQGLIDKANQSTAEAKATLVATKGLLEEQAARKKSIQYQLDTAKHDLKEDRLTLDNLRLSYQAVSDELKQAAESDEEEAVVCGLCGQALPEDQQQEHHRKHMLTLEQQKGDILKRANTIKAHALELQERITGAEESLSAINNEEKLIQGAIAEQEEKIKALRIDDIDLSKDEEYQAMLVRIETLKAQLVAPDSNSEALNEQKQKMQSYVERFMDILRGREEIKRADERVAELVNRGQYLTAKIAAEQHRQDDCEEYMRQRADSLSDSINGMFSIVQFRLFEQLISGAQADDCTPMVKSASGEYVELMTNGSNSERIRAGLDIVKALQKHAGIHVPVFIDNAEATTTLPDMSCQTIRLVVSKQDKRIRVEIEGKGEEIREEQKDNLTLFDFEELL